MDIWEYTHPRLDGPTLKGTVDRDECLFCSERLERLVLSSSGGEVHDPTSDLCFTSDEKLVRVCAVCGWWAVQRIHTIYGASIGSSTSSGAIGGLRQLDLSDVHLPISEIQSYLAARYERRFDIHPRVFEETVASVFRGLGYQARVTAYTGDDGIDVILDGPTGDTIGIQVKRYQNAIDVEQIRALTGALVLGGMTHGMFVTTAGFQSGAQSTSQRLQARGHRIELYDSTRFYEALKIAQRRKYQYLDDPSAPYTHTPLVDYDFTSGSY